MLSKHKNGAVIVLMVAFSLMFRFGGSVHALTGVNQELSFEGKIATTSTGVNIVNGSYNMEFNIYTGCTNNTGTGCTSVWTEDWLVHNSQAVTFDGGTFQVNLGALYSLSNIPAADWNTYPLYLSVEVGNTVDSGVSSCAGPTNFAANCGGDGVMSPYILLTSTPYSLNSNQLNGLTASQFGQITANNTWTGQNIIQPTVNAAGIFQVETAAGASVFYVGTLGNNFLTYSGFEAGSFTDDAAGWQAIAPGTIAQNTNLADVYNGLYSLKLTTTSSGGGAQTNVFNQTVTAGTYDVSFYVMPSTAINANIFTITLDDTTTHTCSPASKILAPSGFRRVDCSVTTTGNLTYLSIVQGAATAGIDYIDAVQITAGTTPLSYSIGSIQLRGPVTSPVSFQSSTNSETAFGILNATGINAFNVNTLDNTISIGSNSSSNSTQYLLQLNTVTTFTEAATCAAATNQGALYYNYSSNNIRACLNGSWQDLVSTQSLALQLFGVVPNSGNNPGDLIGASATSTPSSNTGGPCKINWASTSTVYVNSCLAFSGGREVSVPATTLTPAGAASTYQNVCLTAAGVPALLGTASTTLGSQTLNNLTTTNATTYGQPLLCLGTVLLASSLKISAIYDARTFTTTTKSYATIATATNAILGGIVSPDTVTAGDGLVIKSAASATSVVDGVVVASNGTTGAAGTPNLVIATEGPQWVFAGAVTATPNDFIAPSATTAGIVTSATTTGASAYDMLGVDHSYYGATCTVQTYGTADCQDSLFTYLHIQ